MKKKLDILKWLLPLVLLLATACGHDDLVPPDVYVEETVPYVELRIAVPLANPYSTRANPMGGEEGNGREHGDLKEDIIHNINVFFFIEKDGLGMDSPDDTKIIRHIYYNLDSSTDIQNTKEVTVNRDKDETPPSHWDQNYVRLRFECTQDEMDRIQTSGGINFVAVANTGKLQCIEGESNLKWLRDQQFNKEDTPAWTSWDAYSDNAERMDYFLMSTAYNNDSRCGKNKIEASTSGNVTSYSGTTTLQRMYSRLDLWYNNSADETKNNAVKDDGSIKELKYQIIDKDKAQTRLQHCVYITNVLPVNVMQKPSYIFKKVTNDLTSFNLSDFSSWTKKYSWGGKESTSDGPSSGTSNYDRPTNYVVERHTMEKNTVDQINFMTEEASAAYADRTLKVWYGKTATQYVSGKKQFNNEDYSIKNTAKGKLSEYYHGTPASDTSPNYDCNYIAIISYANENTHPTDCFHSDYLTGMAFRGVYVPEIIYSGSTTTIDEEGKKTDEFIEAESVTGGKIYRYSQTNRTPKESYSIYFSTEKAAKDYDEANPEKMGIITSYDAIEHTGEDGNKKWGFICYYNLWLRHYNDVDDKNNEDEDAKSDPHEHLPMEYATVRNNIYRVSVSFSGPGDPEPTMREPDTMKARIFVRKWNYRPEDDIYFNY